jgi:hypothetical protein
MKKSFLKYLLGVTLPVLCMMPSSAYAGTIFAENFDSATVGLNVTSAGAFSTFGGTNVDVLGGSTFGFLCAGPTSGQCVDLGGSGGDAAGHLGLTTALNLAPGTYYLSFDLIGSGRGQDTSTTVNFGSYSQTFLLTSGDITSGIVLNQAVTIGGGPTQLQFLSNGLANQNIGSILDNVSISDSSPVPEPGTLGLMATGLLGAAGFIRRRFQA